VTGSLLGGGWMTPRGPLIPEDEGEYSLHLNGEESPWVGYVEGRALRSGLGPERGAE
jgi:hypothetical protein